MMPAYRSASLRGELCHDTPLARLTSWRVGGPARQLYAPADVADLGDFLAGLDADEPVLWLGLGSNLLIRDGGFGGTVIATQGCLNKLELDVDRVAVEAGVSCAKLARACARAGLTGAAFLAGIPGTVGGALAMNAGAFGGETWRLVRAVTTIDRQGLLRRRTPDDFHIAYREVRGAPGEWFVACELALAPGDVAAEQAGIRELLAQRALSQPIGQLSCGSTFRNPPGDYAARLIDTCGLKGRRVGGAEVSRKHANFIINTGTATAADIECLIELVVAEVARTHGVHLQPEVHIVGKRA